VPSRASRLLAELFRDSPLRHLRFRLFYFGAIGTAVGYTMQATVSAWLMATLTPSALMVALVQTASTAPSLLFGLLAGALADIVDRRRILVSAQLALLVLTALLGLASLASLINPFALLGMTFAIGAVFTFYMPTQQATVNDMVPREELARAVALGAVAFNLARAIGPALAGAIAAWIGTANALLVSAAFFTVMIVALRGWQSPPPALPGVPETLLSAVQAGLRYARHSPPMRALILRNLAFSICASALWALLPVVARDQFGLGAGGFGMLSGSFGAGAVIGTLSIPRRLQKVSLNKVVTGGVVLWAVAILLIAWTSHIAVALVGTCAGGAAWVSVLASLSAGTQSSAPGWVRARAVATNLVAVQASLALGGALWGSVASLFDTRIALAASAAVLLVLLLVMRRVRVALGHEADVMPGVQLPDLRIPVEPLPEDGPVLIQIEYRVEPQDREAFLRAIRRIEPVRRRNGASNWLVFRDLEEDGRFVERFIVQSWAEYVRLRMRATMRDRELVQRVSDLQKPGTEVKVSRLIGVGVGQPASPSQAVPAD
jgi:MFS family permease